MAKATSPPVHYYILGTPLGLIALTAAEVEALRARYDARVSGDERQDAMFTPILTQDEFEARAFQLLKLTGRLTSQDFTPILDRETLETEVLETFCRDCGGRGLRDWG